MDYQSHPNPKGRHLVFSLLTQACGVTDGETSNKENDMTDKNKTIQEYLNLSEKEVTGLAKDEQEAMKIRNVIEVAIRNHAPDWLKRMIEEDDTRITKH